MLMQTVVSSDQAGFVLFSENSVFYKDTTFSDSRPQLKDSEHLQRSSQRTFKKDERRFNQNLQINK